jgi:hypothetical protein
MCGGNTHGVTWLMASTATTAVRTDTLEERTGQIDIPVQAERSDYSTWIREPRKIGHCRLALLRAGQVDRHKQDGKYRQAYDHVSKRGVQRLHKWIPPMHPSLLAESEARISENLLLFGASQKPY